MIEVNTHARPRAGLLGNPSDLYGGRGVGFTYDNAGVSLTLRGVAASSAPDPGQQASPSSPRSLHPGHQVPPSSPRDLQPETVDQEKSASDPQGDRLLDAARAVFAEAWVAAGRDADTLLERSETMRFTSDIPRQAGLSGSSAIVIAALRALSTFHGLSLPPERLAELALRAEVERLAIRAGPMDRIVQAYEGLLAMDFAQPFAPGATQRLPVALLGPLVLSWNPRPGRPSGDVHASVAARHAAGDAEVSAVMRELAIGVDEGLAALRAGKRETLMGLVNRNFDLRARLFEIDAADRRMIELGRARGAATKFCGSGGAVLAVVADTREVEPLIAAYRSEGFEAVPPTVTGHPAT